MESYWNQTAQAKEYPALTGERETDVVIIGGGITGALTAYRLKEMGVEAVILEADRVGSGTTGGTTGKITAQHGLLYAKLIADFGKDCAKEYAGANARAVKRLKGIVDSEHIECDFMPADSFVYSLRDADALKEEAEAMKRLDLDASYVSKTPELPFSTLGAVRLKDQAHFHPLKFLYALTEKLTVFENSRVVEVKDDTAYTKLGSVHFKRAVFACRYPIINAPGYYFLRMSQQRSFLAALRGCGEIKGMYVDENDNGLTLRPYKDVLLFGAFDVRSGKNPAGGRFLNLLQQARALWPELELTVQWSAEDCRSVDNLPYIGRYSEAQENWYVATGFNKWGMTNAMAAADILSGMIAEGKETKKVFSPGRFALAPSAKNLASDVGESVSGLLKGVYSVPEEAFPNIERGKAALAEFEGMRVCVYRDAGGRTHILPSRCSHLGCRLEWNADDAAWECPCHGSRFTVDGAILDGPTVKPMGGEDKP
ncbi:MAG TPA: FAD-dependent oxidoreductase [Clostridia bacterium]|nr:FAD-dependent oxidoreductase [Clostridia bacterium]